MSNRDVTLRRNIEQIVHCAEEALSVVEQCEDLRCAIDDLEQARALIQEVLPKLREKLRAEGA